MARSTAKPRQKNPRARKARRASTSLKPAGHAGKKKPIDLYYWPTPNGWKITIMLEECALPYTMIPGRHLQGRPAQAAFSGHLSQQPHAGDRRSRRPRRQADLDLRVRRDSAISRPQDRKILSAGRARPRRSRPMAVLADGQSRPQGGGGEPLPKLCGREAAICHRASQQRDEPNLRRHEHAARGPRVSRRQLFDRRYRVRRLGEPSRAPRPRHERLSQRQALARNFAWRVPRSNAVCRSRWKRPFTST